MTRIDTSPVATCVIQDEACRDFSDDLLVHPAMRIPNASATVESPIGLNAVPFVVEVQRPYDTVVGVEVEGHVFESDRVVSVSHDEILAPTYDLTVESEPEYIANGILVHNTFTKVITEARQKKLPIHTWCFKEVLKTESNPTGWMTEEFIERKRLSVPAEMFRVEYELGEPAGGARAFDLTALEDTFVHMEPLRHTDKGSDEELVFEEYHRKGVYAAGADWAKEKDFTVITVIRVDCDPWRTVYVRKMNRRPWPYMIGQFNEIVSRYQAVSAHDATGLGNVVHDLVDERTSKILMVGKDRTKLLTDYITAVERGKYQMPRNSPLYEAHRSVTVDEVFGGGQWNSHLADEVAACAIAHRAAATQAPPAFGQIVPRGKQRAKWMEELDGTSRASSAQVLSEVGIVTVQEEVSDVGVFWLP